ncbi:MAG TPA: CocE/NonD family hydrolase [Candidatus Limnocylindrales bacterium]
MTHDRSASEPVHAVDVFHDLRIPVRDGLELSANLWRPVTDEPVPAILELIPYRKDDWRANSDEARGRYLAARGYAFCRVDIRGTGSSPGIARDEYTAEETGDGYDVVEWLAAQPWCNGNVGMWGISYGGFTAIQVAALRPPHLNAIVPVYASDDRYLSDVHVIGGCLTASELTQYAVAMVAHNALPGRPAYRGAAWRDEWRERLERTPIWLLEWARQQHDGPYWRQGSLAPDYERITAAILMIGGWMDSYVDPVLRMLDRCVNAPRRAIVGNWVHDLPDTAYPGPNLDWLHELVRFFDHWLKGAANGVMDEPGLTWFRREWAAPEPFPETWPGSWIAERAYPAPSAGERVLHLATGAEPLRGRLAEAPGESGAERLVHRPALGTRAALSWGAGGPPNGLARDLRPDESLVPTYTSDPLAEAVDILGIPLAVLSWSSPVPVAAAVVRLSDVAPDGTPIQVTSGVLNLTHRNTHERPEPMPAGGAVTIQVPMRGCGYRFLPGHRIRLSVASSAWPIIWPSPDAAVHVLGHGGATGARLILPAVAPPGSATVPAFKTSPPEVETVGDGVDDPPAWRVIDDVLSGEVTVATFEGGSTVTPDGTRLYGSERHEMTACDATPAEARMTSEIVYRLEQDGARIEAIATAETASTASELHLRGELRVRLDDEAFFERTWDERIPRHLV